MYHYSVGLQVPYSHKVYMHEYTVCAVTYIYVSAYGTL